MAQLSCLIKQRGRIKAKLTAFSNFLSALANDSERQLELASRLEKAEGLWSEFDLLQNNIEDLEDSEAQNQHRISFEDLYHELISKARRISMRGQPNNRQASTDIFQEIIQPQVAPPNDQTVAQARVKLPSIELPKFNGNYEQWVPFRDLFESLIDANKALTAVQKLYYLRSALTGDAAKVIASLEITNDNYIVAWELLKNHFENNRLIVQYLIQTLLDLSPINRESYAELRQLVDNISQYTQTLSKLEQPVETWGTLLIHIILPKVDKGSRREWELKRATMGEFPTLAEFIEFLVRRSAFLEALSHTNRSSQSSGDVRNKTTQAHNKNISQTYISTDNLTCAICSKNHKIQECNTFLNMPVESRHAEIKKRRLCVKCLKGFHGRNCKTFNCKECRGYHHTLLHKSSTIKTAKDKNVENEEEQADVSQRVAAAFDKPTSSSLKDCNVKGPSQVLLSTAVVMVRGGDGASHECRALLDSGSQSNFITRKLSEKLKLRSDESEVSIVGISNTPVRVGQQTHATIQSRVNSFKVKLPFLIVDKITERLPIYNIDKILIDVPRKSPLADPNFHIPQEIDLLLGASIFWELICEGQMKGAVRSIVLQETRLGWIVSGRVKPAKTSPMMESYCGTSITLSKQLEKFWNIEEVEPLLPVSQKDKVCEEHFTSTYSRNSDGRFVVKLPLKPCLNELGTSYDAALKRLKSVERKLKRQPQLKQAYQEFMSEYLRLSHMSEVPPEDPPPQLAYYLPHHAVIKEDSETTKVRVVFDASCRTSSGLSLNDCLMAGPIIQDDLFDIILRLRQHKYAISADIIKMYRQVTISKEHTDLQRILWRWTEDEPVRIFRLNTVTYGMASSSFLAIRCLQEIAWLKQGSPEACEAILRDFYVDDLLTGAPTVEALWKLKQNVTETLHSAGFELQKWRSNVPELGNQGINNNTTVKIGEQTKILGLLWDTADDTLQYKLPSAEEGGKVTKRRILAQIAQIYDPLGWLGPITVQAKLIMQRLWQANHGWDDPISGEIRVIWTRWISNP